MKSEPDILGLIRFLMWCFAIPMIAGATLLVAHIWVTGRCIEELRGEVAELQHRSVPP